MTRGESRPFEADPFAHDDAAYVLGLLAGARREEFEQHLAGCADCTERVDALTPAAAALAGLDPSDWAALAEPVPPVPDDLLPQLLRAARRRRARLRAAAAATVATAAAAVVALLVVLGSAHSGGADGGSGGGAAPVAAGRPMTAVTAAPVRATAVLTATSWGTRITVDCRYASPAAYRGAPVVYTLRAVDTSGARHQLGSWIQPGRDVRFTGGTSLPEDRISAVQVALPDGATVLTLSVS